LSLEGNVGINEERNLALTQYLDAHYVEEPLTLIYDEKNKKADN